MVCHRERDQNGTGLDRHVARATTEVDAMMTQTRVMRVLVVDDERIVCSGVEKILVRKGHSVEQALSVADAVTALERDAAFDMILADLMMPQAGGLDMVRIAKSRWPRHPVIIMTGYASIGSAIDATRAGAAGYLPKPFTPEELEATIERVSIVMTPRPTVRAAAKALPKAKEIIDVDMPFDADEVAAATSPEYVKHLTRSDVSLVDYCDLGERSCKRYKTKGACSSRVPAGRGGTQEEGAGRDRRAGERLHRRRHALQFRRSGGGHLGGVR